MDRDLRRLEAMMVVVDREQPAGDQRHRRRDSADRRRAGHRLRRLVTPWRPPGPCWRIRNLTAADDRPTAALEIAADLCIYTNRTSMVEEIAVR